MKNIRNMIITCVFILMCSNSVVAVSNKPFTKIPDFKWILTSSATNGKDVIETYFDVKNFKMLDGYRIYWEKFTKKSNGEIFYLKYAIDCNRQIKTLMGGIIYNINGYAINNVEGFTDTNFKMAPEWENVDLLNDKTAQKACIYK